MHEDFGSEILSITNGMCDIKYHEICRSTKEIDTKLFLI